MHNAEAARPERWRYGDYVKKGDVMFVIWSKEIGEKKSELVDAISKLDADKKLLERLESVEKGVVAEKMKSKPGERCKPT